MSEVFDDSADSSSLPLSRLLENLRDGTAGSKSSEAAQEILRRFHPLLRKYWRWQNVGEYEDFLQEVMVRLFSALPHLRDPDAFPGLLRRIVLATSVDLLRQKSMRTVDIADINPNHFSVEFDESISTPLLIRSYLELLPPREREVLFLSYFADLSPKEVAQRLGLSAGAVRMTKSRALLRLRRLLRVKSGGESS
jgi:RNA polymerase sigma-70 factor (ECF subfamily)